MELDIYLVLRNKLNIYIITMITYAKLLSHIRIYIRLKKNDTS